MKLSTKDIVLLALLSALLFVSQVALSGLANVELVSIFIILFTLFFRQKTLYIIYLFALLEGLIYGFGLWWICYLYVWTILWGITMLLKKETSAIIWAFVSGFFGLAFGTFCSIPYFFISGIQGGLAWIVSGLMFDLTHGVANFIIALLLFRPLHYLFSKVYRSYYRI